MTYTMPTLSDVVTITQTGDTIVQERYDGNNLIGAMLWEFATADDANAAYHAVVNAPYEQLEQLLEMQAINAMGF